MKNLAQILGCQSYIITNISNKILELNRLDQIFRLGLDEKLVNYCQLGKYENNEALIILKNPIWATRLRYNIPDIIKNVQIYQEFRYIKKIRYIIDVVDEVKIVKKPKKPLSIANERLWKNTIMNIKQRYEQNLNKARE